MKAGTSSVNAGAITSATVFNSLVGTPSGHDALWGFRLYSSLDTPFTLMVIVLGGVRGLSPRCGSSPSGSWVNTSVNHWLRMLAFMLLSLYIMPLFAYRGNARGF